MSKWIRLLPVCFLFATSLVPLHSQVLSGSVVGLLTDTSGGAVPNASVTVTNRQTGFTRSAQSGGEGRFSVTDIPPGSYTLEIAAPGFRPISQVITVTINTVSRVDVELSVGTVSETMVVQAEATPLQTDTTDVHVQLESESVTNMPLPAYRNYQSLFSLVAGATPPRTQNAVIDTPGRSLTTNVNGTVRNTNFTRTDGAANIFGYLRHHTVYTEPSESIETVNISTNNFDAEQGLAGGASITVLTKSGSNEIHGVAFAYHDNQHLRARNFFLRTPDKPKGITNIYGGTLGGPIKKNKLFYFLSWEATRERLGYSSLFTVPTAEQRAGNFSAFGVALYDPLTGNPDGTGRQPFANATIPLDRQSSIAQRIQQDVPLPNQAGTNSNFFASSTQKLDRNNVDAKLNWNRSQRHQLFAKYSMSKALVSIDPSLGAAGGPGLGSGGSGDGDTFVQLGTIGNTWIITPNLLLDGTFGYSRLEQTVIGRDYGTNFGLDVLGIPGTNGPDILQSGQPIFDVSGYTTFGNPNTWTPAVRNDDTFAYTVNLGWTKGTHDVRFGYDLRYFRINHWQPEVGGGPRGSFDFGGGSTALNGGPSPNQYNSYAQFLLGVPDSMQKSLQNFSPMSPREYQMGWYARDRWQLARTLTLTYGLRYEYYPLMTRAESGIERYDPETNQVLVGGFGDTPENAGTTTSKKLFAPRVGVAWRVTPKTAIRSGYGISYIADVLGALMRSPYPVVIAQDFLSPNSYVPFSSLASGIPSFSGPDLSSGVVDIPSTAQTNFLPKGEYTRGYIQSYNFVVEREILPATILSVGYVGTRTVNQGAGWDLNAAPVGGGTAGRPLAIRFGRTVSTNLTNGMLSGRYNSLQASVNRRFSGGLLIKGAYTFSRTTNMTDDNGSDSGGTTLNFNHPSVLNRNRGLAGYDRTHVMQLGWVYELPFGPGKPFSSPGVVGMLARDWQVNGTFSAYTGTPFTVTASGASLNSPGNLQTADQINPEVRKLEGIGAQSAYYDPFAFAPVTTTRFGTSGRNILRGPGVVNVNASIYRNFRIFERLQAQFRAEVYNLSNTPHFNNPGANVSNLQLNSDGSIRSLGGFMAITGAAGDERQFRFGMRLSF